MTPLTPGDNAPAFKAPDQNEKTVRLADFAGRRLFLFFYPKANTGG
jgi:peroxiredoxin Q/BCP